MINLYAETDLNERVTVRIAELPDTQILALNSIRLYMTITKNM